ncbi:hypothetical protein Pan153_52270 [Gimesia panareensis]|uniref:Uncharacterized protein n=1 Tax=Gimesia panareensis TaxID=2527978 RepID=A0A518FW40_9PLAN|nr:hypothetical protein [Gimesia panareensis]QDV20551.1 hypothetical protein Pan153_52270 [Gimesia panareensis]
MFPAAMILTTEASEVGKSSQGTAIKPGETVNAFRIHEIEPRRLDDSQHFLISHLLNLCV